MNLPSGSRPILSPEKHAVLKAWLREKGLSSSRVDEIIPRNRTEIIPLSFEQQRLWFLDRLNPSSSVYNVPVAMRLNGPLNGDALRGAVDTIVSRHEVLRTTFTMLDGVAAQVISPRQRVDLKIEDVREIEASERNVKIQQLLKEESNRPFNLSSDLMVRLSLLKMGLEEHILLLVMHHVVTDDWSLGVFFHELTSLYKVFCEGGPSLLPQLPVQYADYAIWQRERLRGDFLEKQLSYWKRQLNGASQSLDLPTDHPRPNVQSYRGARESLSLSKNLTEALKVLSREAGVTLFMTLLAAFKVLLHRYTGQVDIVVGSPTAGRTRAETEGLIGFFVNNLVMRTDLSGNPSFRELSARVRDVALSAYEHQDLPFEKLVEELQPERDGSRNPLFQVMFTLQNVPSQPASLTNLSIHPLDMDCETAKFDLWLSVGEEQGELKGFLEYSNDLFNARTIRRMLGHLQTLIEGIVVNPEQRISELPMLTASERHQLLVEWNDTKKDYSTAKCLHALVEKQVERTPEAIALIFEDQELTYRELNSRANQLAYYLIAHGVGPETLVGICMERSLEMVVALLGILKAGGAYVPLDPGYPTERLAFMLEDAKTPVVVTQARLINRLPPHAAHVVCLNEDWEVIAREKAENPAIAGTSENLAYVIYTSGSTGQPKGAMNTHRGICNRLLWMQEAYQLTEADRVLQKTPFSFDVSVWEFFWPLLTGARLVLAQPGGHQDSAYLIKLIFDQKITTLHFVPSMLQVFLEEPDVEKCSSLKRVICSGEALSVSLQERFFARLPAELHDLYGPTEAAVDVTFWVCKRKSNRSTVPIGRPIANTQIYILDRQLQPVPIGVPGELCIGGVGVARGYLNRPELTAEKFIPNLFDNQSGGRLYRTGDLARYLLDGNIEYLGRIDDQVKIRGFRIELGEIESVLSQHAGVRETVVMVREDIPGNRRIVGYVVASQQPGPTSAELRDFLQRKLPEYMIPTLFVFLKFLPLSANGKIDRRALPTPNQETADKRSGYVPPVETIDFQLVQIWEELLDVRPIGMRDNFFELGGHSLLAVQMMHRVEKICGEKVSLSTLLAGPTIEHLARALVKKRLEESSSLLVKVQLGGSKRPFFFLHSDYAGGGFYCLNLARGLGENQPFYALTPHGLNGRPIPNSIEAMAADYLRMVRTVQPEGPYIFGGVCGCGVVAFEMAQQLQREGQSVDLLLLVGPAAWNPPRMRYVRDLIYALGNLLCLEDEKKKDIFLEARRCWIRSRELYRDVETRLRRVVDLSLGEQILSLLRLKKWLVVSGVRKLWLCRRFHEKPTSKTIPSNRQASKDQEIYDKAFASYVRYPYSGRVVIFWPVKEPIKIAGEPISSWEDVKDETLGWSRVVKDLTVYGVPGSYVLLFTTHIKILAAHIKACLEKVQAKTKSVVENNEPEGKVPSGPRNDHARSLHVLD